MRDFRIRENVLVGFCVGAILSCLINLFIIWGGKPQGIHWRVEETNERIDAHSENYNILVNYVTESRGMIEADHSHRGIYGGVVR